MEQVEQDTQIIEECLSRFRENDALMNPDILKHVARYIRARGEPGTMVQALVDGYRGYSQITDLMISWMRMTGISEEQIDKAIVNYLKGVILKHFDSVKADAIFSASNVVPQWLDFMINDAEWRSLIYQLSEHHKSCLILNFAIQRISESGYHDEIASVTSASSSFRVFHRILSDAISKLSTQTEETLRESTQFADFKKMCSYTQHNYIYAQCQLRALAKSSPNDSHYYTRLAEELEAHAIHEQRGSETTIRKIGFLFIEYDNASYDRQNGEKSLLLPEVTNSLMSMLSTNATNPSDVTKLHKLYSSPNPPPVEFLNHRDVYQLFVRDLYSPSGKVNPTHKSKYVFLLAYAASSHPVDGLSQQDTEIAIQNTTTICSNKTAVLSSTQTVMDLRKFLQYNVVCKGILYWMTCIFTENDHIVSVYSITNTKLYMALLKEIAYKHPELRENVTEVIKTCFEIKTELDPLQVVEIRRIHLDVYLYLFQTGYVLESLSILLGIVNDNLDMSLVRHVVTKIISFVEPPFSVEFVHAFSSIICHTHVKEAMKTIKELRPYVEHVLHSDYSLSNEQREALTDILN